MKVLISGSRRLKDNYPIYEVADAIIKARVDKGIVPTELHGCGGSALIVAANAIANEKSIPFVHHDPHQESEALKSCDGLIAIWNGHSVNTHKLIKEALETRKHVYINLTK